jgi:hypothetical protein
LVGQKQGFDSSNPLYAGGMDIWKKKDVIATE